MTAPKNTPVKSAPAGGVSAASTPAKPAESEAAKASRTAPIDLDFAKLTPTKVSADVVKPAGGAGRKPVDNSVAEKWLTEAWNERKEGETVGTGRAVHIPTEAVVTFTGRLRKAAQSLGYGLSVKVIDGFAFNAKTQKYDIATPGKSTVNWAPKTAKKYAPRTKKS